MITTKRKNQPTHIKSKQKSKPNKQQKQTKKKKQAIEKSEKLKPTASKKQLKLHNHDKQLNQEVFQQNENQNKSNIPSHLLTHHHKVKAQLCHQMHADVQYVNMRRSASVGGLKGVRPVRKSLSPGLSKQKEKNDIRHKYSSKPTSRSEKQKLKQPGHGLEKAKSTLLKKHAQAQKQQKQKITRKKSQKQIKNTSQRLKTENSSKIPEGKQKQQKMERISQKKKSSSKLIKIKPILKTSTSKMKLKAVKAKEAHKSSVIFSEVSFHDNSPLYSAIMPKQNFYVKMEKNQQNKVLNACITIQKHFRGYLTRKYIQETKYMIYSIIKIQKVWRGYCCRKKLTKQEPQKKNLSIQNSLITIKDFSEEPKQQRLKNKSFKFNFEIEDSKKKQQKGDGSSLKKSRNDDGQEKYINILEALLMEEGLDEKFKDKIRSTLGKEKYVQQKIYSQIVSEKSFNSPRQLRSPKASLVLNSPSSWSKHKQISQSLQNFCTSPRNNEVTETLNKRINSPLQSKSGLNSSRRLNTQQKIEVTLQVKPIQTSFEFIEEFQLRIVDYLRDNSQIKENFLSTCQKCQQFRTYLVMSQWNIDRDYETQYFSFLQSDICPDIFPKEFREEIISENSMKIYLQDNNYLDSLWISNSIQGSIYQGYLKCIFDSLAEAIYNSYKSQIITRKSKNAICHFQGHELFKLIFMNSLTLMQGWNEYMCGAQIPVNEGEPNYKQYCEKNNERLEIMIKNSVASDQFKEQGSVALWIELAISEAVYEDLMNQFYNEFFV